MRTEPTKKFWSDFFPFKFYHLQDIMNQPIISTAGEERTGADRRPNLYL